MPVRFHLPPVLRRFSSSEDGILTTEFVLVLPILMWAYVGTFVYFDAFNSADTDLKASYTIADLISRQTNTLTDPDIEGMNKIFDTLNSAPARNETTWIRVTNVYYDYSQNLYRVKWSSATRGHAALTDADINNYASHLPQPAYGDTELLVETSMTYTPAFNVGIAPRTFTQVVVTRPRMGPNVAYSSS